MFVVERPASGLFYLKVVFRAGAAHEAPAKAGISHLLEHLLFKSKGAELQRELLELGGKSNAYTDLEHTAYHVHAPAPEYARVIRVVKRLVAETCMDPDTVEREKRIVIQERAFTRNRTEELYQLMLEDTPYGKSVIGTRETIDAITPSDLRRYHRERYLKGGCHVAASCPSEDAEDVAKVLAREFGTAFHTPSRDPLLDHLKNRDTLTIAVFDTENENVDETKRKTRKNKEKKAVERMDKPAAQRDLSRCTLMWAVRVRRDLRDVLLDRFMAFVLFEVGPGSALYERMRAEKQLTYRITGGHNAYTGGNVLTLNLYSESDILYVNDVLQNRLSEIRRDGLFSDTSDLSRFKKAFKASLKTVFATQANTAADLLLTEVTGCQKTSGCAPVSERKKKEVARVEEGEFLRRVTDLVDGIDMKEMKALTSRVLGASRLVAVFGNNTRRTDREFREALRDRMRPDAVSDGLRLRTFLFDDYDAEEVPSS